MPPRAARPDTRSWLSRQRALSTMEVEPTPFPSPVIIKLALTATHASPLQSRTPRTVRSVARFETMAAAIRECRWSRRVERKQTRRLGNAEGREGGVVVALQGGWWGAGDVGVLSREVWLAAAGLPRLPRRGWLLVGVDGGGWCVMRAAVVRVGRERSVLGDWQRCAGGVWLGGECRGRGWRSWRWTSGLHRRVRCCGSGRCGLAEVTTVSLACRGR